MKHPSRAGSGSHAVSLFGLVIGLIMLLAATYAGEPVLGFLMLAIMAVYVAVLSLGGRVDVVQVLRGEPADERYTAMDNRAIAFAANVVALTTVGMFLYEIATGGNGGPYSLIGFVFGVSYIGALIWLRLRG